MLVPAKSSAPVNVIITDETVARLYLHRLLDCFAARLIRIEPIVLKCGEDTKSLACYSTVAERCLEFGVRRTSTIYSFGGGVISNIAGFVAATLYRGLDLVHIPTTMLAQVDGAVDTKQAVNSKHGKNLVGAHYYPRAVVVDPSFLMSLSLDQLVDGLAEFVKHAIAADGQALTLLSGKLSLTDVAWLTAVVTRAIDLKVTIRKRFPETDYSEMSTQYGHCVAHALEHLTSHRLSHGRAISIGMCVSAELGRHLGVTADSVVQAHYELLTSLGLPVGIPEAVNVDELWRQMSYDKNNDGKNIRMGLVQSIGRIAPNAFGGFSHPITFEVFNEAYTSNVVATQAGRYRSDLGPYPY